ncbi:MAG: carbamoyltransferase N-terminal domain-containing protein [Candidatus Woesearchaeota archaeon]
MQIGGVLQAILTMPKYLLGISCYYHDASATLLKDGLVVAAAEEERFTRKKHDTSFPVNAISYCLQSQDIGVDELEYVAFYEKPFLKFERLLFSHLHSFPRSLKVFLSSTPSWINEKLRIPRTLKKIKYKGDVIFVNHHIAHAASSFLPSPFKKAAILTVDAVGEWTTTTYGIGQGKEITLLKEIRFPHSIGLLYSAITAYLGFSVNSGEYKCLHPQTAILFADGSLSEIGTLFHLKGVTRSMNRNEEIRLLDKPVELVAFDKSNLRMKPCRTNVVYRKKANTLLLEIELKSGRKVTVTPNHKFTTYDFGGVMHEISAKHLKVGEFVVAPKKILIRSTKSRQGNDWARLLAYSISEGHELIRREKHEAEIRIGTMDIGIINDLKSICHSLGKNFREWSTDRKYGRIHHIGISVWKDLPFLEHIGYNFGKRAGSKSVPAFVCSAGKKVKKEFMSALYTGDGSITGHQLIYSTKSRLLAEQIAYILLNFGIYARIRKILNKRYGRHYYRVELNGRDLRKFSKEIGFLDDKKNLKLRAYVSSVHKFGNQAEYVPINDYLLDKWIAKGYNKSELYRKAGYHFWDYKSRKRIPTPRMLIQINKLLRDSTIQKFIDSDIYFDKVKSVRWTRFDGYVYDVFIPKHHAFVGGFGGIILHNTMGLSAYGTMDKKRNAYYGKLRKVIDVKPDGSFMLDMSYFVYQHADRMPSKKLFALLGGPVRKPESEVTKRHEDIAAALQMVTEDVMQKMLVNLHYVTKCDNLVIAGGVALNSVFNGKILRNTPFANVWIQPAAGDAGTSMGAALYLHNVILGRQRKYCMSDAYLGPGFTTKEVKEFLEGNKIKYKTFKDDKELVDVAANLIFQDNVVGWFQGRMEWGPRALGARSILSNPCNPRMQEILNLKVKHRECYDEETQILTEQGWKLFKNLNRTDRVATLNPKTRELVYQAIKRIVKYDYEGNMVHFMNRRLDLMVTPEHNIWANRIRNHAMNPHKNKFEFIKAANLVGKENMQLKSIGIWKGKEAKYFLLPKIEKKKYSHLSQTERISMDLWLEFLGYYLSEGSYCYDKGHHNVYVAQRTTSKFYKRIDRCLNKLYRWRYNSGSFKLGNKQLYEYLKQFGKAKDKFIPQELLHLCTRQLKILFDALMCGDGTYRPKQYKYATTSKRLADNIQELGLKLGYSVTTSKEVLDNPNHNDMYYVRLNMGSKISWVRKTQGSLMSYSGKVYCITVPKYNILCVKRKEKIVFSGNSFRPFAPVVCEDDASEYFDCDTPIPEPADFMLMVYPIREKYRKRIPAVTHVDGSGRLQTVRRFQNSLYYDLIKCFGRLSGIPILINTSFNIRGEPIVCTPHDAYKCMMGTGIDYLVIDKFLVNREDNPQHMWDSEKHAMD